MPRLTILGSEYFDQITSTSGNTGTGLKKCNPIKRSGPFNAVAISSKGIAEVFVAKIALALLTASRFLKTACLTSSFSATASMIRSASVAPLPSRSVRSRANAKATFSSLFRRRSNNFLARAIAPTIAASFISVNVTSSPAIAPMAAISPPITPAPTTCIRLMPLSPRADFRTASVR